MWYHNMGLSTGMSHWFSGLGIFGMILNILIIFALITFFMNLFKSGQSNRSENHDLKDSLKILKYRLAKGEITEDEYHQIKRNL